MGAILLLEDGRRFVGEAFGAVTTRVGEAVFNTAMSGYQEVLTDPSYAEQVVCMTAPHIGNTGINLEDEESERVYVSGFIVRSLSRAPSNWRSTGGLHRYLADRGVPGMQGIDTRALVRHLRDKGAMRCVVSTDGTAEPALAEQLRAWPGMLGRNLAEEVACAAPWVAADPEKPTIRFAVLDGGIKRNILRLLGETGAYVRVHPITDSAEAIMDGVDAVLVGNGPGDPAALTGTVTELKKIVGKMPVVGICLGHQLLALTLGAETYKLKFGHRGANQPVRDERTGRVEITSQNHGFGVDAKSLAATGAVVTHTHLNDLSVSGFVHEDKRVFAVQYHPEAAPGPHDARSILLHQFVRFAKGEKAI
ncbi:MAG: glutamine-hydrolyzing carbamoyl-phosphate synthase small subunit [Deltaproteobacteria bacterium]|nr:glutamine-hydrolyzing carbamoyl-phosphate synthase small subunit [Deltaproteobacteria bacterium]